MAAAALQHLSFNNDHLMSRFQGRNYASVDNQHMSGAADADIPLGEPDTGAVEFFGSAAFAPNDADVKEE